MTTIQVNKSFTISRDTNCWTVRQTFMSEPIDGGEPKQRYRLLYYATLEQACKAIIDRSAGRCYNLEEIIMLLKGAVKNLTAHTAIEFE
tara:strand:- start:3050 stop:3316 length:267 start_codon:yes stop_codon:yes gene_type:complete